MKRIGILLLAIGISLASYAQTNPVYIPMKSAGGHTATASGYQKWVWSAISSDTISNADTTRGVTAVGSMALPGGGAFSNLVWDTVKVTGNYASGSIQCTFKKVSGTPADTAVLQVSDDGITWISSGQDTMLITNVSYTQTHIWSLPGRPTNNNGGSPAPLNTTYAYNVTPQRLPYQYYRVYVRTKPAQTQAGIVKCFFLGRQF